MDNGRERVVDFIRDRLDSSAINQLNDDELMGCRYLDLGYIDSFQIIHFIMDIEREFGIVMEALDTESDKFRHIGGLIEIIESKL